MLLLDVDIPAKEDVTCCFCGCQFEEPRLLQEHENNCGVAQNYDQFDRQIKTMKRDLQRLKFQHYEVFGRLVFNEKIPVKQRIRDMECTTCDTLQDHLQGQCLLFDKLTAFNIVTEKMRAEELRIKYNYIDIQFQSYFANINEVHENEEIEVEEQSVANVLKLEEKHVSPRTLRMARRDRHHDLIHLGYAHQRRLKNLLKDRVELSSKNRTAVVESMNRRLNNARLILRMTERRGDPPQLRFISTSPEPQVQ